MCQLLNAQKATFCCQCTFRLRFLCETVILCNQIKRMGTLEKCFSEKQILHFPGICLAHCSCCLLKKKKKKGLKFYVKGTESLHWWQSFGVWRELCYYRKEEHTFLYSCRFKFKLNTISCIVFNIVFWAQLHGGIMWKVQKLERAQFSILHAILPHSLVFLVCI